MIEDVSQDATYCLHPTPALYGFQSYASFPIVLPDGTFFGRFARSIRIHAPDVRADNRRLQAVRRTDRATSALGQSARRHTTPPRRTPRLGTPAAHAPARTHASYEEHAGHGAGGGDAEPAQRDVARSGNPYRRRSHSGARPAQDMLTETNWETTDIRYVVQAARAPHTDGGHRFTVEGVGVDLTTQQWMGHAWQSMSWRPTPPSMGRSRTHRGTSRFRGEPRRRRDLVQWSEVDGPEVVEPGRRASARASSGGSCPPISTARRRWTMLQAASQHHDRIAVLANPAASSIDTNRSLILPKSEVAKGLSEPTIRAQVRTAIRKADSHRIDPTIPEHLAWLLKELDRARRWTRNPTRRRNNPAPGRRGAAVPG